MIRPQLREHRVLNQLQRLQARMSLLADDDVVVDGNAERLCDGNNLLRRFRSRRRRKQIISFLIQNIANSASEFVERKWLAD